MFRLIMAVVIGLIIWNLLPFFAFLLFVFAIGSGA